MVVTGQQTQETLERWVFDVHTDKSVGPEGKVEKSQKEITSEIQAIIRQVRSRPHLHRPSTDTHRLCKTSADHGVGDVPAAARRAMHV